jgi:glutathione synthase/RimK-type ligase-like ATP-grasp enzyme
MRNLIVVSNLSDLKKWRAIKIGNLEVILAKSYLTDSSFAAIRNLRVYNLCRSYRYQSNGYYVSLLAEARGHKVFPSATTIQDVKSQKIIQISSDDLEQLIQRSLAKIKSKFFVVNIYFGRSVSKQYANLAKEINDLFAFPLLRAHFVFNKKWILQNITPISLSDIYERHIEYAIEFAKEYFAKKRFRRRKKTNFTYDLAILFNSEDKTSPSNKRAIKKFVDAGEELGMNIELIDKDDGNRIGEFDALFIRETTAVNHYTYRFARRALANGLIVIDDPDSILKCTNKVYLAELLTKAKVPRPKTLIIHKDNKEIIGEKLGFPCVIKQPDSSFSQGVIKISDQDSLNRELDNFLNKSELIIAQEFMPTDFDWRIGILDRVPIFACRYYMTKGHWQIYDWDGKGIMRSGDSDTIDIHQVPDLVIKTALKAANLIGDGFYGVDLKEKNGKVFVIEVNDNPSVDAGTEDQYLGEKLYFLVMQSLLKRIKNQKEKTVSYVRD